MMVSPKSVGDVADTAEENNRECGSNGGCVLIVIPPFVVARPESTPVPVRLLLFVLAAPAAALTQRRRVLEADFLKQLPTNEVDGRFVRKELSGADIISQFRRAAEGDCCSS